MWHIRRTDPLSFIEGRRFVALVGGGGKTSLMEYLASRAVAGGLSVAVTTTTKIYAREPFALMDRNERPPAGPFLRIGGGLADGKLTALSFDAIIRLGEVFDLVLIEADGAKGRPLKCPAGHEPVVPPFADMVFVVAGLDGLGGTVGDRVFRWRLLPGLEEDGGDIVVDMPLFVRLFRPDLMMKSVKGLPCTVVLNKYDTLAQRSRGRELSEAIAAQNGAPVIFGSVLFKTFFLVSGRDPEAKKGLDFSGKIPLTMAHV
jgi:probable selenium-dependent hydroxylase accessory protein YqeC